jgi:hypothetical protein
VRCCESRAQDGWLPMALELAMRCVADGSSARGPSANGRSRLTEARCRSGLLVDSRQMSSRGYDGMLPTFQKRRQQAGRQAGRRDTACDEGKEQRWAAAETERDELLVDGDCKHGQEASACICTTLSRAVGVA